MTAAAGDAIQPVAPVAGDATQPGGTPAGIGQPPGFYACRSDEIQPGERVILELNGRSVGVFNVDGSFHALRNRCPHSGGALCLGPVTGTTAATRDRRFVYGMQERILRCAWHGWEFEIATGRCLVDPRLRAKTYPVVVHDGAVYVVM